MLLLAKINKIIMDPSVSVPFLLKRLGFRQE